MVVKLVGSLAGLLQYHGKTVIDSCVFRLHYRWTSSMLFLACVLLTCTEIIGNQFICLATKGMKKADNYINNYCMITSTYTLDVKGIQDEQGDSSDIEGLGKYDPEVHEKVYHAYYLWVPFVLFGMGCMFYVPHIMWKSMEGKTVEKLLQDMNRNSILCKSSAKVENIVRYVKESKGINGHYFHMYMVIEVLNLVNVVTQMCLLDKFIGGQFWKKGIKSVINLLGDEKQRQFDPMIQTFPRITKCHFESVGTSGTTEKADYMCLLPQNILNEKIFLIIWIWFIFLTTITASYVVMRLLFLLTPILNAKYVDGRSMTNGRISEEQIELQQSIGVTTNPESIASRTLSLGDYCLLELLQENLDHAIFQDILKSLQGSYSDPFPGFLWIRPYSEQLLESSSHPLL